jgi:hypothetical protein
LVDGKKKGATEKKKKRMAQPLLAWNDHPSSLFNEGLNTRARR